MAQDRGHRLGPSVRGVHQKAHGSPYLRVRQPHGGPKIRTRSRTVLRPTLGEVTGTGKGYNVAVAGADSQNSVLGSLLMSERPTKFHRQKKHASSSGLRAAGRKVQATPEDAAYVLARTDAVGFVGASSMERLPVETAIAATTRAFKAIALGQPPPPTRDNSDPSLDAERLLEDIAMIDNTSVILMSRVRHHSR
jgi:hypothetical protein